MRAFTNPHGQTRYQPTRVENNTIVYAVMRDNWGMTARGYDIVWTENANHSDPMLRRFTWWVKHIERKRGRKLKRKAKHKVRKDWNPS